MSGSAIFINALRGLVDRVRGWKGRPAQVHPFDRTHGVDTSGLYYADRLPSGHEHDRYSEGYYATAPSLFHGALAQWQGTLSGGETDRSATGQTAAATLRVEDYTFVDLGCGKGRVVMMASLYPFRSVRGIELNSGLVRVARRNLRRWLNARPGRGRPAGPEDGRVACQDVEVVRGDVLGSNAEPVLNRTLDGTLDRILDSGSPVVLFLFNSFGAEVLGPLMGKLAAAARSRPASQAGPQPANPAPIDLIYIHPDHDRLVAATDGTELLRFAEIPFSYEDVRADVFGVASDLCSVYRLQF